MPCCIFSVICHDDFTERTLTTATYISGCPIIGTPNTAADVRICVISACLEGGNTVTYNTNTNMCTVHDCTSDVMSTDSGTGDNHQVFSRTGK